MFESVSLLHSVSRQLYFLNSWQCFIIHGKAQSPCSLEVTPNKEVGGAWSVAGLLLGLGSDDWLPCLSSGVRSAGILGPVPPATPLPAGSSWWTRWVLSFLLLCVQLFGFHPTAPHISTSGSSRWAGMLILSLGWGSSCLLHSCLQMTVSLVPECSLCSCLFESVVDKSTLTEVELREVALYGLRL